MFNTSKTKLQKTLLSLFLIKINKTKMSGYFNKTTGAAPQYIQNNSSWKQIVASSSSVGYGFRNTATPRGHVRQYQNSVVQRPHESLVRMLLYFVCIVVICFLIMIHLRYKSRVYKQSFCIISFVKQ